MKSPTKYRPFIFATKIAAHIIGHARRRAPYVRTSPDAIRDHCKNDLIDKLSDGVNSFSNYP